MRRAIAKTVATRFYAGTPVSGDPNAAQSPIPALGKRSMPVRSSYPLSRFWFTWSDHPAEMVCLPLGLKITPVLYSTRLRRTCLIEPRRDMVRLGAHTLDSGHAALEVGFADTALRLRAGCPGDPFSVTGDWERIEIGEWGARFWVVLAISAPGAEIRYDATTGAVLVKQGPRWCAIVTRDAPILVTGHETQAALCADLEENGYFSVASRAGTAPVLGLRFNLDMMARSGWAAGVGDTADLAIARARAALMVPLTGPAPLQQGAGEGALDAVRDIIGWNTVWDPENTRAYTKVTRIWNLGDFAVWYNDQCYAALLAGVFDPDLARQNLEVAHGGATPQGNVACIVTSNDAWLDRSQPPLGSLIAWLLYLRTGERSILAAQYQVLLRNQRWWRAARDPDGTGLMSCGTSDVGEGLYRGTHFAARNETGMDNSATHDEARYDPDSRSLSLWDLGLNCVVALDAEMLARIAAELGEHDTATEMAALAQTHRALIREKLWDPERQIFSNRQRGGGFVRALSPTSFYPMLCGAADAEQTAALLHHLDDPESFATPWPLPNATRDDPAYRDNVYWRGRVWPNVNYLVWLALHRSGEHARAADLARRGHELFQKSWREARIAGENYNPETGEVLDQGDADSFYIWAGLLPMMAVEEICGFSPWTGWTLRNGPDAVLGPVMTPLGPMRVTRQDGWIVLADMAGQARLSTDHPGAISDIRFTHGHFACTLSAGTGEVSRIALPGVEVRRVVQARLDGAIVGCDQETGGVNICVHTNTSSPQRLEIWYAEDP